MKTNICILFFLTHFLSFGQESFDYQEFTKKMCSWEFHGRGYVNQGDLIAAKFIANQMEELGIDSLPSGYFQAFTHNVNTFPDTCSVQINTHLLEPGIDYVINPISNGTCKYAKCNGTRSYDQKHIKILNTREIYKNDLEPSFFGDHKDDMLYIVHNNLTGLRLEGKQMIQVMSKYNNVIELIDDKFIWSIENKTNEHLYIQMKKNTFDSIDTQQGDIKIHLHHDYIDNYISNNVIGHIPSKRKSKGTIMITAHYDHLGRMGTETYFPGANDNASGVAMLLALGETIKSKPLKKYNTLLVAFAGEEAGLVGSKYMTENPLCEISKIRFLLNLDIMGSGEHGITAVNGRVFKKEFKLLQKMNQKIQAVTVVKARGKAANSDHYFFTEKGVRSFFVYTMGKNKNYHDIFDTYENLNFNSFNGLAKLFDSFLRRL